MVMLGDPVTYKMMMGGRAGYWLPATSEISERPSEVEMANIKRRIEALGWDVVGEVNVEAGGVTWVERA